LLEGIRYFFDRFRKPIIITENGFCTSDDAKRVAAIRDYAAILHRALAEHYPILGYYHWTAWDNFEWTLGMQYRFGLFSCDPDSLTRYPKASASVYAQLAHRKFINLEGCST
jgi:beta-glucosidase